LGCRCWASFARASVPPPANLITAAKAAMSSGLNRYNSRDTEMLMSSVARALADCDAFATVLDMAVPRVLGFIRGGEYSAKEASLLLWAFARIGYQSDHIESMIEELCGVVYQQVPSTGVPCSGHMLV
jgi:hypothetical protein